MSEQMMRELKALRREVERLKIRRSDRPQLTAACMRYLMLPELRAFWPFSSVDESGNARDLSGQGRTLTNNNSVYRGWLTSGLPYAAFDGLTKFWSRADESGLDITGNMTLGSWVYNNVADAAETYIGKLGAGGTTTSFFMGRNITTGTLSTWYTSDGTVGTAVALNSTVEIVEDIWTFVVMRFTSNGASSELANWVNGTKAIQATAVSSIFNSAEPLTMGAYGSTTYFDGNMALAFLCAAAVPDDTLEDLYQSTRNLFGV